MPARPGRRPAGRMKARAAVVQDRRFDSHLGHCQHDPVVQRRRHLPDMQATMVQFHPGSDRFLIDDLGLPIGSYLATVNKSQIQNQSTISSGLTATGGD